jgi:hypothetical protein
MSGQGDEDGHDDDWLRQTLASLERPAMPDQVAARLDAVLASSGVLPPAQRPPSTASAQGAPRRGRGWLIGAGAAAAVVLALVVVNPLGDPQQPQQPQAGPSGTTEADVARVLTASAVSYTQEQLPQQSVEVAKAPLDGAETANAKTRQGQWASVATLPAANTKGAAACVVAIESPAAGALVFVDRAAYEGQPALIVARRSGIMLDVHVLRASCTVADPAVVGHASVVAP